MNGANNWLDFANDDLIVAMASLGKEVYNLACFHAHQGTEKMLKGYLAVKGKDIPIKLCAEIDQDFGGITQMCIKLDDYYIPTRYPDALPGMLPEGMPNKEDALEAISILEEVMDFVSKKM